MITSRIDTALSTAGGISSLMVAALETAWSAIQAHHPELPPVVMVLGAGSGNGPGLTLGHFAAMRWRTPEAGNADPNYQPDLDADHDIDEDDEQEDLNERDNNDGRVSEPAGAQRWAEVFVGGEGLARGPAEVLATLLHEAAHALAHVRGSRTPPGRAAGTTPGSRHSPRRSGSAWRRTPGWAGPRPACRPPHARHTHR